MHLGQNNDQLNARHEGEGEANCSHIMRQYGQNITGIKENPLSLFVDDLFALNIMCDRLVMEVTDHPVLGNHPAVIGS